MIHSAYPPASILPPLLAKLLSYGKVSSNSAPNLNGLHSDYGHPLTDYQSAKLGLLFAEIDEAITLQSSSNECILPQLLTSIYAIIRSPETLDMQDQHYLNYARYSIGRELQCGEDFGFVGIGRRTFDGGHKIKDGFRKEDGFEHSTERELDGGAVGNTTEVSSNISTSDYPFEKLWGQTWW